MHLSFSEKHFRSLFYSENPRNPRNFLKPQVKNQSSIYSTLWYLDWYLSTSISADRQKQISEYIESQKSRVFCMATKTTQVWMKVTDQLRPFKIGPTESE